MTAFCVLQEVNAALKVNDVGGKKVRCTILLWVGEIAELGLLQIWKKFIRLVKAVNQLIFTTMHGMQMRSSDENSVCPCVFVCLSVKHVICDKTKKSCDRILAPHERPFTIVLWGEEWLVWGDRFHLKFWVSWPPLERNCRFWTDINSYRLSRNT